MRRRIVGTATTSRGAEKNQVWKIALVVVTFLLMAGMAFARNPKLAVDLDNADPDSNIDVIVQFKHPPTEAHHQMVRHHGGALKGQFESMKGAVYTVPASGLDDLASDPEVVHISPNRTVHGSLDLTAAAVNADAAWVAKVNGSGIGIAIIDSGITNASDLNSLSSLSSAKTSSRVVYQQDFVGGGTDDRYGHGEHVAGIAAGNGSKSMCVGCTRTFKGMAPMAKLINLRVLDSNGNGFESAVIAAIDRAIALKSTYNIRVINLSLGRPVFESYTVDPLCQAVEAAWQAGIVVVVAAGNDGRDNSVGNNGYGTIEAPGNDPFVITVGAMKTEATPARYDDLIASYSSKGPTVIDGVVKPDLVAPGNVVVSLLASTATLQQSYPQTRISKSYYGAGDRYYSSDYFALSGTSMAAAVVSGAAALLLQAQPSLTPDQLKARLMRTAYKAFPPTSQATDPTTGQIYVSQYDVFTVGAGYLDIDAALADTSLATGSALSPTASFDTATQTGSLVFDSRAIWGTGVWDARSIWGQGVLSGSRAIWGTSAIWGQSNTSAFRAIWGSRTIWGQSDAQATSVVMDGEK